MENPRRIRAFGIVGQTSAIRQIQAHTFKVKSQNGAGEYVVKNDQGTYECSCPDFQYRAKEGKIEACKHVLAVRVYETVQAKQDSENLYQLYREIVEPTQCRFCGSERIIKRGYRKNKTTAIPRYKCKACGRFFVADDGFLGTHTDPKVIAAALDLWYRGVSLRRVAEHLRMTFGIKRSNVAVYKWLMKYIQKIAKHLDAQVQPKLSGEFHTDEMFVKCKGKVAYNFNTIDADTRFLLASNVYANRDIPDTRAHFQSVKAVAERSPTVIATDGMQAYAEAFRKEFFTLKGPRVRHYRKVGIRTNGMNQARIERLHNTIRSRESVLRGFKKTESANVLMTGYRIWYDYIREHQGLKRTPSEVAEIDLRLGTNKWIDLIRKTSCK